METKDRFRGCLLGLALGDAVGTTLEFKPPGSFKAITGMAGGGPFRLKPGECPAASLPHCHRPRCRRETSLPAMENAQQLLARIAAGKREGSALIETLQTLGIAFHQSLFLFMAPTV